MKILVLIWNWFIQLFAKKQIIEPVKPVIQKSFTPEPVRTFKAIPKHNSRKWTRGRVTQIVYLDNSRTKAIRHTA